MIISGMNSNVNSKTDDTEEAYAEGKTDIEIGSQGHIHYMLDSWGIRCGDRRMERVADAVYQSEDRIPELWIS